MTFLQAIVSACNGTGSEQAPPTSHAAEHAPSPPAQLTTSDGYQIAYAYSPRENVGSTGKYHLITTERIEHGRLVREPGDALCKPTRKFWGLDGGRTAEDFERYGCVRCREIRDRLNGGPL